MGKYPKEKVPELYAAKRALIAYLKDHNIDPSDTKRIQTDPELRKLVYKLNKERDKVMANYPALDKSNNIKLLKMAKEDKKAKKAKKVKEVEAPKTEKKKQGRAVTKYDYPQVKDEKTGKMRDMTSAEKKKYRMEQRKAANGGTTTLKKKDKAPKEAPVENKKKKASKEEKSSKKKTKKVKKEED